MKITKLATNNRRRVFEVETRRGSYVLPYATLGPTPTPHDRIADAFVDPELGREAFTYVLESGAEGSVHIDSVLEYNEDPAYMAKLALYNLTVEARHHFKASELSARELARRLGTSPAQLYRLLDPTNDSKSINQLIQLLYVLGFEVDIATRQRSNARAAQR